MGPSMVKLQNDKEYGDKFAKVQTLPDYETVLMHSRKECGEKFAKDRALSSLISFSVNHGWNWFGGCEGFQAR